MNSPTAPEMVPLSRRVATSFVPPQLKNLDQWQVMQHLGSGSTANVWLMQHCSGTQYAACKTPKSHQDTAMLSQEAELAASLSHENLISTVITGPSDATEGRQEDLTLWEYLPGGSLANLIAANGKLTVAQTVTVLLPLIQVTEYLHSQQIVHGDISPHNILFDLTGRPVLIDLGATRATAHSYSKTGTPGFVAPELVAASDTRKNGLDAEADIYSLAAIGWFCVTGTIPGPPYARVPLATIDQAVDRDIVEVLEAALSEQPALRPTLAQLRTTVSSWAEPEPVDLFPAVGEEYQLVLPTRKPAPLEQRSRRKFWRRRQRRGPTSSPRRLAANSSRPRHHRRMFLSFGFLLLVVGGVGSAVFGPDSPEPVESRGDETVVQHDSRADFQSIVDTLAKDRTVAWVNTDASLVDQYAIDESDIYSRDTAVLESLDAAEHSLDGLRMRAEVESTEYDADVALVTVQWRIDGYAQRDGSGEVIDEFGATTDQLRLSLEEHSEGWRIAKTADL